MGDGVSLGPEKEEKRWEGKKSARDVMAGSQTDEDSKDPVNISKPGTVLNSWIYSHFICTANVIMPMLQRTELRNWSEMYFL